MPFVTHAPMEPLNCTAHVQEDRCDIWVPTQGQTGTRMTAAGVTKLPPDKINVHTTLLGCGFGRRSRSEWVVDAVSCSKAVGKPVKVVWTREEDIKNHFFRAATCQKTSGRSRCSGPAGRLVPQGGLLFHPEVHKPGSD